MNVFGEGNKTYFRADEWQWRVIHQLMDGINKKHGLQLDMGSFAFGDGSGFTTKAQCQVMSEHLRQFLVEHPDQDMFFSDTNDPTILIDSDGQFLNEEEIEVHKAQGLPTFTPYRLERVRLDDWVDFLQTCGNGFKII